MGDMKKSVQGEKGVLKDGSGQGQGDTGESKTAGTNRDYDESQESANQGHGHPRGQRPGSDKSGQSDRSVSDTDRQQRDLGGPGG